MSESDWWKWLGGDVVIFENEDEMPSVIARKPTTEAGRALRDHIVRLDYGAYDAARCLMVDDLGADPGSIGEPWNEALRLIEDQAAERAVKAFPLMASVLALIASEAQQNGNWATVRYWANEALAAAEGKSAPITSVPLDQ